MNPTQFRPTYSVVVPVYNSSESLPKLAERLKLVFEEHLKDSYEIVFVDDSSPNPETWTTLRALATYDRRIRIFQLARNFGQGGALLCGMKQARGQWVITMDDDLQHYPEDIPKLVAHRDHDVVIGRFPAKKASWLKKLSSRMKSRLDCKLLGMPEGLVSTPFKLMKRQVTEAMLSIRTPRPFIIALVLRVTSDLVNVETRHAEREHGESNYSLARSLSLISGLLFNNSSALLRMMAVFGFCLSGLSVLYGGFLIAQKLLKPEISHGWTSLMVVILMLSGFIICCIGILGEYVSRLIETSENRPTFIVGRTFDQAEDEPVQDIMPIRMPTAKRQ